MSNTLSLPLDGFTTEQKQRGIKLIDELLDIEELDELSRENAVLAIMDSVSLRFSSNGFE